VARLAINASARRPRDAVVGNRPRGYVCMYACNEKNDVDGGRADEPFGRLWVLLACFNPQVAHSACNRRVLGTSLIHLGVRKITAIPVACAIIYGSLIQWLQDAMSVPHPGLLPYCFRRDLRHLDMALAQRDLLRSCHTMS
jgi:hypothetical protein